MKYLFLCIFCIGSLSALCAADGYPSGKLQEVKDLDESLVLKPEKNVRITVFGQGVAPAFTTMPAQAQALAKRAALVDGYRLIAERIKGVSVEGQDTIKNMQVTRSEVRAHVQNIIKNATIVNTVFKDGLCEVELEVNLNYSDF